MQKELMNAKEVGQYLRINFRHVYKLAKERRIPGTNVSGKWVFPKHLIDQWIELNSRANCDPEAKNQKKGKLKGRLNVVRQQS